MKEYIVVDLKAQLNSYLGFIEDVIDPIEREHRQLFNDPRLIYGSDGVYSIEVQELAKQVRMRSAEAGWYTALCSEKLGGHGWGEETAHAFWEELYKKAGPNRILPYETLATWTNGPNPMLELMQDTVRERILPEILSGAKTVCFALSEPNAGSDVWGLQTTASRSGTGWVLNGEKTWITGGSTADYLILFAVTDEDLCAKKKGGVTAFIVPSDMPGVERVGLRLFGSVGGNEASIYLRDVEVSDELVLGSVGDGFKVAMIGVAAGRIWNAARCVGWAQWALDLALEYASNRSAFGNQIISYQGVSHQIADIAIEIAAAKGISMECARLLDRGDWDMNRESVAMAKLYATEMCFRTFDRTMQVMGGRGFLNESMIHAGWHMTRILRVAEGTTEILKNTIVK
jgi:acyl-CoA dehydrogenase